MTPTPEQIEAAAEAICMSWPKDPNGCAALCMDRLGCIPKEGCRHALAVHGKRAEAILTAAAGVRDMDPLIKIQRKYEAAAGVVPEYRVCDKCNLWVHKPTVYPPDTCIEAIDASSPPPFDAGA